MAFEILFIFIGVNYIGASLIKDKINDAGYKYQQEVVDTQRAAEATIKETAEIETKTRREYAEGVEGVVISEVERHAWFRIEREHEMEQECLEVFKTLPSWKHITEWNTQKNEEEYIRLHAGKKTRKQSKEEDKTRAVREWTYCILELVYFANRGKIPRWLLSFDPDEFSYLGAWHGGRELMLWWRNKLRSFGFYHELWFCCDSWDGEKYKCEVEYSKKETFGDGKYYWDTEFDVISLYQTRAPKNMKGLPFSINEGA